MATEKTDLEVCDELANEIYKLEEVAHGKERAARKIVARADQMQKTKQNVPMIHDQLTEALVSVKEAQSLLKEAEFLRKQAEQRACKID